MTNELTCVLFQRSRFTEREDEAIVRFVDTKIEMGPARQYIFNHWFWRQLPGLLPRQHTWQSCQKRYIGVMPPAPQLPDKFQRRIAQNLLQDTHAPAAIKT